MINWWYVGWIAVGIFLTGLSALIAARFKKFTTGDLALSILLGSWIGLAAIVPVLTAWWVYYPPKVMNLFNIVLWRRKQ
jgi:hypothetical protein